MDLNLSKRLVHETAIGDVLGGGKETLNLYEFRST